MTELLLVAMFVMVVVAYRVGGRTLVSPFFILSCAFLVASAVVVAFGDAWDVSLHVNTIGLIVVGLLAFGWGQVAMAGAGLRATPGGPVDEDDQSRPLPGALLLAVLAFNLVTCALYYLQVSAIVQGAGDVASGETFLGVAREARVDGEVVSGYVGHLYLMSQALSMCLLLYRAFRPVRLRRWSRDLLALLPVAVYAFNTILTTGRGDLIQLAVAAFVMSAVAQYRRWGWARAVNGKLAALLVVGVVAFAAVFALIGAARIGVVEGQGSDDLTVYVGSGIVGLDYFLNQPIGTSAGIWGGNTLYGVYSALRSYGYDIPELHLPYEFRSLGGVALTNIYTAFRRYYEDFSLVGTVLILVGMGMVYGRMWRAVARGRNTFSVLVYAVLAYPLAQMAAEDSFFMKVVSSGTVYELVYLAVVAWGFRRFTHSRGHACPAGPRMTRDWDVVQAW